MDFAYSMIQRGLLYVVQISSHRSLVISQLLTIHRRSWNHHRQTIILIRFISRAISIVRYFFNYIGDPRFTDVRIFDYSFCSRIGYLRSKNKYTNQLSDNKKAKKILRLTTKLTCCVGFFFCAMYDIL